MTETTARTSLPTAAAIQFVRSRGRWLLDNRLLALRWVIVLSQAVTIVFTWPLWHVRDVPPNLPLFSVPQIPVGILLVATLALTLWSPGIGISAHCTVLLYAFVADQVRLQPEVVSHAILLIGTLPSPTAGVMARAHLVALWIWSGLNKALSLHFSERSAMWIFDGLPVSPEFLRGSFGWIVLVSEALIGVCLLVRPLRRIGIVLAFGVHAMILTVLLGRWWNPAVWPWNAALPVAAALLFWPAGRKTHGPPRRWVSATVFAVLLMMPVGFYAGYVDAYLAHNLYSDNTASASVCEPGTGCTTRPISQAYSRLRVPMPPEPRVYTAFFVHTCRPGERLVVLPRSVRLRFGRDIQPVSRLCP